MTAKKTPSIKIADGTTVSVDADASYKLTLAKAVKVNGHIMRPSDRNIEVTGEVLVAIAATADEGAVADADQVRG